MREAQRGGGLRIAKETKPIVEATTSLEARLSKGAVGIVASNYSTDKVEVNRCDEAINVDCDKSHSKNAGSKATAKDRETAELS